MRGRSQCCRTGATAPTGRDPEGRDRRFRRPVSWCGFGSRKASDLGAMLSDLVTILREHRVALPPKPRPRSRLSSPDGLGRLLDPDFLHGARGRPRSSNECSSHTSRSGALFRRGWRTLPGAVDLLAGLPRAAARPPRSRSARRAPDAGRGASSRVLATRAKKADHLSSRKPASFATVTGRAKVAATTGASQRGQWLWNSRITIRSWA